MMEAQYVEERRTQQAKKLETTERWNLADKLDAVGWALFFIWLGIAFLMDVGNGIGLLGVGIITLGMQVVRRYSDLKFEGFWVVVGVLFATGRQLRYL